MRSTCPRCLRPLAFCVCAELAPAPSATRVVLLQHPREARLAICSAWLTRLALQNAELHQGVSFREHPRVREVLGEGDAALLYPSGDAAPVASRAGTPPRALVVIDGTWKQAEKMLSANPELAALPRLALAAPEPSGYGALRREPASSCLSTLEAVAWALGELEGDLERFQPMRAAFRKMVELQLACSRDDRRRPRHRRPAPAPAGR